jgi:hypothetical protein
VAYRLRIKLLKYRNGDWRRLGRTSRILKVIRGGVQVAQAVLERKENNVLK